MKNPWLSVGVVALLVLGVLTTQGAEETANGTPDLENAALIVIDIQAFYFPGGKVPLVDPEAAAENAAKLIAAFRAAGRPVIHVQHLPKDVDTPDPTGIQEQYRIYPEVLPKEGEVVIGKHYANSFRGTDLLEILRGLGVERVVIAGMQTHMCVEAAVRAAADYGFDVTLVDDACATRDLTFGGTTVPAAQVHAAVLAAMESSYAKVVSTDEFCGVTK